MKINKKILGDLANFIQMRYGISVAEYQEKYPELFKSFMRMQYWLDEVVMERYFSDTPAEDGGTDGTYYTGWKQKLKWDTRKTGQQLLDKIKDIQDLSPDVPLKILDVGCGTNEWRKHFDGDFTGIDPYHSNADFNIGITEYAEHRTADHDIILALGSINFGDQKEIELQISNIVNLVKPGGKIFWRCNPGITHDNPHAQWIDFFPWSEEFINDIAERCKCTVNEISWDHPEDDTPLKWGNRLYSEWTRNEWAKP